MNRTLKLFLALVSLCMTVFCFAQKSELRFNKDGKFKNRTVHRRPFQV